MASCDLGAPALLTLCIECLARQLCSMAQLDAIAWLPEPEIAQRVAERCQALLPRTSYRGPLSTVDLRAAGASFSTQRCLAEAFAATWWQTPWLRLRYALFHSTHGLSRLSLLGASLQHLELEATHLASLRPVAACTHLRCLSLRGCAGLGDASLAVLAGLTSLRALDLSGLEQLTDGAVAWVASLPALEQLVLDRTGVTDAALQMLTYGCRLAAWAAAPAAGGGPCGGGPAMLEPGGGGGGGGRGQGSPARPAWAAAGAGGGGGGVPSGAAATASGAATAAAQPSSQQQVQQAQQQQEQLAAVWPPLPLRQLRLVGTRVTAAGAAQLVALAQLQLLDVRRTAVPRTALQPLQQRFGLQLVQAGVLAASMGLAAVVVNQRTVACCCGGPAQLPGEGHGTPCGREAAAAGGVGGSCSRDWG